MPSLDPFPAWRPVLVGAEGRRVGHWENSLQEGGGIPCSVWGWSWALRILSSVDRVHSLATSEQAMFGSEGPPKGGTSCHSELHTSCCPLISSALH